MIQLREYQANAINNLRESVKKGHKKVILQAATGSGKTIVAAEIINSAVMKGKRVLFMVHRKELVNQTSLTLDKFGIEHGVIMAQHPRKNDHAVQIASIQTITNRDKPPADLMIIDEGHLSLSKSYKSLIAEYPNAVVICLSATPIRNDGQGMGEIYKDIVQVVPMSQLIAEGHLVKPRVFAPFIPNMKNVRTVKGDYDATQTAQIMDKSEITGDIIKHWQSHAQNRKTIVFAASVRHSKNIVLEFQAAGISARHLDATTPAGERDKIISDFRAGEFKVLSNMAILIEGFDCPDTACVILARPTKSLIIYLQAVGRVMRPAENKTDCIILDHAGLTYFHNLVDAPREWTLDGKDRKARDEIPDLVHICDVCFCAYSKAEYPDKCPECGVVTNRPEPPEVRAEGQLVELTAEVMEMMKAAKKAIWAAEMKKCKTLSDFIELGKSRGYKYPVQWAGHQIRQRQEWKVNQNLLKSGNYRLS